MLQETTSSFKIHDAGSYDHVTDRYDHFTVRFCTLLARHLLKAANLAGSEQVLDVGTGTGILALEASQHLASTGKVVGVDLSQGMLATARANAGRVSLRCPIEFRQMDAEVLELEDQSFDRVLSLFALLHFPNPGTALREMFRVLRPGGRLVIAVGSGAPLSHLASSFHGVRRLKELYQQHRGYRLEAPGFLNRLVEKYLPGPDRKEETSWARNHPNRARILPHLIQEAGFSHLRCDWKRYQVFLDTPEEFWEMQVTYSSLARKRLAQAPEKKVASLRDEFLTTCQRTQGQGGKLAYAFAALTVSALRAVPLPVRCP